MTGIPFKIFLFENIAQYWYLRPKLKLTLQPRQTADIADSDTISLQPIEILKIASY